MQLLFSNLQKMLSVVRWILTLMRCLISMALGCIITLVIFN